MEWECVVFYLLFERETTTDLARLCRVSKCFRAQLQEEVDRRFVVRRDYYDSMLVDFRSPREGRVYEGACRERGRCGARSGCIGKYVCSVCGKEVDSLLGCQYSRRSGTPLLLSLLSVCQG